MNVISRRTYISGALGAAVTLGAGRIGVHAAEGQTDGEKQAAQANLTKDEWLKRWMNSDSGKDTSGSLLLGRFLDRTYYVAKPIAWKPNANQATTYKAVEVPVGFVTDLASIPRAFWSFLPTDGEYVFAAIVHDYLYWMQCRSREASDSIFKFAMTDLGVSSVTTNLIYGTVHLAGQSAWRNNKKLKSHGERRVLSVYPDNATARWDDWKKKPNVFAASEGQC